MRKSTILGSDGQADAWAARGGDRGGLDEAEYDRLYALAESALAQPRGRGVLPFYMASGQRPS
jgi:hypothetical protein